MREHLCFETLADPLRLSIIRLLKKRNYNVNQLAEELNAERSRVSHSLSTLRKCNYVEVNTEGKNRIYSLKKGTILTKKVSGDIFTIIEGHTADQCMGGCHKLKLSK